MEIYDVVTKLIGVVEPVGETNEDDRRYENLQTLIDLTEKLLFDIGQTSNYRNRVEFSMKRAGDYAKDYLNEVHVETRPDVI